VFDDLAVIIETEDVTRLSQVIQNLLTNAAKYTEPGGQIEIRARHVEQSIELVVQDNGVGIPADMLPHVFDLFVQGRQSADRSKGGLGLGLTLVRTLVRLHSGTVEARSEGSGRGSQFIVRLPPASPEAVAAPPRASARPQDKASRGIRALIVDDNHDAASMLTEAMQSFGYDTRLALDGPSALDVAARFKPHVVLLDLGLPVMDGYEVAERLRLGDVSALLVAVTGYGQEADRSRSQSAGFVAHFVKPVDLDELRRFLERLPVSADGARP
jgi:CheY-like chemotaxis protein/anti-sigma regulatory factor (Ser/Thr protein kinase)